MLKVNREWWNQKGKRKYLLEYLKKEEDDLWKARLNMRLTAAPSILHPLSGLSGEHLQVHEARPQV